MHDGSGGLEASLASLQGLPKQLVPFFAGVSGQLGLNVFDCPVDDGWPTVDQLVAGLFHPVGAHSAVRAVTDTADTHPQVAHSQEFRRRR